MKKIQIYLIAILTLGMVIAGCNNQMEDYESTPADAAPTATIAVEGVGDSTFTLTIGSNASGYLGFILVSDTTLMPAAINIISGNWDGEAGVIATTAYKLDASGTMVLPLGGLLPDSYYKVYTAASNTDGMESEVVSYTIKTNDNYGPTFSSSSPEISEDAVVAIGADIVLSFDEPILKGSGKFTFNYFTEGVSMDADSVVVNGNSITIVQPHMAYAGDYVFLSWEEGAVTDLSGNVCEARESAFIAGTGLVGNYYRTVNVGWAIETDSITPSEAALSDLNFAIKIIAPFAVELNQDYVDGDLSLFVTGSGMSSTYSLAASNIMVTDSAIMIMKPFTPDYGQTVSLIINEGVFLEAGYDNPCTAIESGSVEWFMSYGYTRDMIIGTYTFAGTSYWAGADESFDVEIIIDSTDASMVYIDGFYGSDSLIPATFDGDFATLTVECTEDYLLGEVSGDSTETYFWSYEEEEFVLDIAANGDMVTGADYWLALYFEHLDGSEGWQNIFTASTWTKKAVAVASNKSAFIRPQNMIQSELKRK